MVNRIVKLFNGNKQFPIFYLSTHGMYPMRRYSEKTINLITHVPENTIIIEVSNAGEVCYYQQFHFVIVPLLETAQRGRLLSYMAGKIVPGDPPDYSQQVMKALSICHIYLPGSEIANRVMILGSWRGERNNWMGFFKYGEDKPEGVPPQKILEGIRTRLIEESSGVLNPKGTASIDPDLTAEELEFQHGAFETYENIFKVVEPLAEGKPKILIFPLCGQIVATKPKAGIKIDAPILQEIKRIQDASDTSWYAFIGKSLKDISAGLNSQVKTPLQHTYFVGRDSYSQQEPLVPFRGNAPSLGVVTRRRRPSSKTPSQGRQQIVVNNNNHQPKTFCNALGQCFSRIKFWGGKRTRKHKFRRL
jgi:hypothetical protein